MIPLLPHEYGYVFQLLLDPLTAGELRPFDMSPQGKAAQLRPLVKRGWLVRDETGIYRASDRAREAVSW